MSLNLFGRVCRDCKCFRGNGSRRKGKGWGQAGVHTCPEPRIPSSAKRGINCAPVWDSLCTELLASFDEANSPSQGTAEQAANSPASSSSAADPPSFFSRVLSAVGWTQAAATPPSPKQHLVIRNPSRDADPYRILWANSAFKYGWVSSLAGCIQRPSPLCRCRPTWQDRQTAPL